MLMQPALKRLYYSNKISATRDTINFKTVKIKIKVKLNRKLKISCYKVIFNCLLFISLIFDI